MRLNFIGPKIFICLFMYSNLMSVSVAQTWKSIFITSNGDRYFIDPVSISKNGNQVTFIQLSNHPMGRKYESRVVYSIKTLRIANCELDIYKSEYLIGYSEINGLGRIEVFDYSLSDKWQKVISDSIGAEAQKVVCQK